MKKYYLKQNNSYLVKGTYNRFDFDGNGKPFAFDEKMAKSLGSEFGYDLEEEHIKTESIIENMVTSKMIEDCGIRPEHDLEFKIYRLCLGYGKLLEQK